MKLNPIIITGHNHLEYSIMHLLLMLIPYSSTILSVDQCQRSKHGSFYVADSVFHILTDPFYM